MAEGGGGRGGGLRAGDVAGLELNPSPLAVAFPAGDRLEDRPGGSGANGAPSRAVVWNSPPPVYFTHPSLMPRVDGSPLGVISPFRGAEQHPVQSSGMNAGGFSSGDLALAAMNSSVPLPSSTCDQRNVVEQSEPEQERRPLSTLVHENSVPALASSVSPATDLVASDPSVCCTDPPTVPEGFPRDPVPLAGRGEGWPYAPQGWPNPDDKWGWRVGKRASASGQWIDRYIAVPVSLLKGRRVASKIEFASKKSLVEYLKQTFPQMKDPSSIFKAFDWKIYAPKDYEVPEKPEKRTPSVKRNKPSPIDGEEDQEKTKKQCRVGNPDCLFTKAKASESDSLGTLVCHICCSEPSFCRGCRCILCCKFFDPDADDFSIIRCLNSPTSGQGVCGHAAHLECALDSRLAGVIKKNGLDMEYFCRRCDKKTDLKETVCRLVSEFMSKTATQSKVESSLQNLLRVLQDPEEEARNLEKLQATINDALLKVQEGADVVKSCKELTEKLLDLRSGHGVHHSQVSHDAPNWSRALGRERDSDDSLHPSETISDKTVPQSKSVGSPDARIGLLFESQGGCEGDEVATSSGARVKPELDMHKELPGTASEDSAKHDHVLPVTTLQTPSELLPCTPLLSSFGDKKVCKPLALSIEEHMRQCEAMASRVKGAGQLSPSPSSIPSSLPGALEVVLNSDLNPPSVTAGSLAVEFHENQVVSREAEASHRTGPPCADELVTSIHSSSGAKSRRFFNSEDVAEDLENHTKIIKDDKVEETFIPEAFASSKTIDRAKRAIEDGNKTTEDGGGDDAASTEVIYVSKSCRTNPPTTSRSEAKRPSLANSQHVVGGDAVMTQIMDVPMAEPPTIPSFEPALETAHTSGLEAEFAEQISEALEKLQRAQAAEYARAAESLNAQKEIVMEQYRQLESVCGELAKNENAHQIKKNQRDKPRAEFDRAMEHLMAHYGKAQEGQKVFESMLGISNGFGRVAKEFLQEFFKWPPSDITEG